MQAPLKTQPFLKSLAIIQVSNDNCLRVHQFQIQLFANDHKSIKSASNNFMLFISNSISFIKDLPVS
jgi:hypothetical protein